MSPPHQILSLGSEKSPILVIDNFVASPELLIDDAALLGFEKIGPYYPGVRSVVPKAAVRRCISPIADLVADRFKVTSDYSNFDAWYSVVTTRPADLEPIQRLPHYDGVEPGRLALLHFLDRQESGGTAFYAHKSTGFETISATRESVYAAALKQDVAMHGMPEPGYISGDTQIYTQIGKVAAKFNRAIVYHGNSLHCADIPPDRDLVADPYLGRLTVNCFFYCKSAT